MWSDGCVHKNVAATMWTLSWLHSMLSVLNSRFEEVFCLVMVVDSTVKVVTVI
jgi:hypothetical protein